MGDAAAAGGGGVVPTVAGDCEDCAKAAAGYESSAAMATGTKFAKFILIDVFRFLVLSDGRKGIAAFHRKSA